MEHTNKQDVLAELCILAALWSSGTRGREKQALFNSLHSHFDIDQKRARNALDNLGKQGFIDRDSDFIPPENGGEPEEYEHFYKLTDFGVDYARPRLSQLAEIVRLAGSLDKTWVFR
jgi:hypothetical protein